jgi:hypothetical protein
MKPVETPKEQDLAPQFEALLRGLLARVPTLKLVSLQREASISPAAAGLIDFLAVVRAGGQDWTFAVETKRLGQPRAVRSAVLQLERFLQNLSGDRPRYGMLLAPFISQESAGICAAAGIGYADLAGNARLAFDQVFIETRSPGNPFREKRDTRSLFSPRAARVLRVMLQGPLRPWKVAELAEAAQVSLGWASAVRQQLLAREWATDQQGGLQVTKPGTVLDAWAKADAWDKRTRTHEYSVLQNDPLELAEKLQTLWSDQPLAFTQWFAGWLRHPYTVPAVVTAYVQQFPDEALIKDHLQGRRVPAGTGRLRLVLPKDAGVFYPAQTVRGFTLAPDVQIYLDLLQAGLRGEEQAEELRKWPDFSGGWT